MPGGYSIRILGDENKAKTSDVEGEENDQVVNSGKGPKTEKQSPRRPGAKQLETDSISKQKGNNSLMTDTNGVMRVVDSTDGNRNLQCSTDDNVKSVPSDLSDDLFPDLADRLKESGNDR